MTQTVKAADLFCGGGGTSSGLWQACQALGAKLELLAINHWNVAISTHRQNHPHATHLCEEMDNVDPRKAVPGGRLNLLVASPECTHHSNARGGKPVSDQRRASAWHILRWAEALYIDSIIHWTGGQFCHGSKKRTEILWMNETAYAGTSQTRMEMELVT